MSGVAALRYLLANNVALVAVVPEARILAGPDLKVGVTLPAILVSEIGATERLNVAMKETHQVLTERVQVTVHAKTYPEVKQILALVRLAATVKPAAAVNGIDVDRILPGFVGPDLSQPEAGIFEQSRDFMVTWRT